ncbi:MAG: phage baseplate protein [Rhodanobacteraceae bacterium]
MSVPATFFLGATQTIGIDLLNTGAPTYAVVTAGASANAGGFMPSVSGQLGSSGVRPVLTPDSVLSLEWHGEERISDYPVQNGQFASYNKVKVPFDLRMVVTCQGLNYMQSALQSVTQTLDQALSNIGLAFGQPMSRDAFLRQLDMMLDSTDLYDVITPDKVYQNVNLVGYNHAKKNDEGGTLIIAELMFREVRESGSAQYSSPSASVGDPITSTSETAATPVNVGTVVGIQPSTSSTSLFNESFPGT